MERSTASARKASRICRRPAPRAFRRPISRVRSETETSITFMMPTPATASETLAMPARARVRAPRMDVNAPSTASWVMPVTSSSPWRSAIRRTTRSFARSRSAWVRTWSSRRKSERRLSIFMAVATGTTATSSMSTPSCWPRGARTPITRIRQSPTRTIWPTGSRPGKSSRRGLLAEDGDGGAAVPLERGEEAAAGDREPAHLEHLVRPSDQGHLAPPLPEGHRLGAHDHGRGLLDLGDAAQDGPRVLEREVVRDPAHARHAAGRLGPPGHDDQRGWCRRSRTGRST